MTLNLVFFITRTYESEVGGVYTWVSRLAVRWSVCWWNVVSQTPPTVFESSKWNFRPM